MVSEDTTMLFRLGREQSTCSIRDAPFTQIVRSQLNLDLISGQNSDVILAHFARNVGRYYVAVFQLNTEHGVWQGINNLAIHFNMIVFRHSSPV